MLLDRLYGVAGDDALSGHGESGFVRFEPLWVREYEERAADLQPGSRHRLLVSERRQGQGTDGNRKRPGKP